MMRMRWLGLAVFVSIVVLSVYFFLRTKPQDARSFTIYAYSSFASDWGAGPILVEQFKKKIAESEKSPIQIMLLDAGDARTVLKRIEQEKNNPGFDIVLGLDQLSINEARQFLDWVEFDQSQTNWNPRLINSFQNKELFKSNVQDRQFALIDWAPMTFVYRQNEITPPTSLYELTNEAYRKKVVLMDPSTSSPGFVFLFFVDWVLKSDARNYLQALKNAASQIASSWSSAYGLFKKKQASLTFSYQTSVAYHVLEENDMTYHFAELKEGHPLQLEYVGIPRQSRNQGLAIQFVDFLLSDEGQKILMSKNYMFPIKANIENSVFAELKPLKAIDSNKLEPSQTQRLLDLWKN